MKPNFLFIIPDQWRYDWLGCAGNSILQTPNLDRLAHEGVRFSRCYTNHPMCMATRATWFTGLTPRGHGVRCNGIPLNPAIPTITQALSNAGYRTHGIGKIHLNPWFPQKDFDIDKLDPAKWPEAMPLWLNGTIKKLPLPYYGLQTVDFKAGNGANGYGDYFNWLFAKEPRARELLMPPAGIEMDFEKAVEVSWPSSLPHELHPVSWAAECVEKFLNEQSKSSQPFFLWLSIPDPHPPYAVAPPWCNMYDALDMPMPVRRKGELDDLPPHFRKLYEEGVPTAGRIAPTKVADHQHRKVLSMAYGMASAFDEMAGKVIKVLEDTAQLDKTVVAFMSDHGQMMGDHWMYSMPPTHFDGVIRVPSIWRFPRQFQQGIVSEALISHLDFAPTVLDLAGVPIPEGFVPPQPEAPGQRAAWPGSSLKPLLTGQTDKIAESVITEFDADYIGLRLRTLVTENWHITAYIGEEYGELFDLRNDPHQLYNLWGVTEYQEEKRRLLVWMLHRFGETDLTLPRRLGHA